MAEIFKREGSFAAMEIKVKELWMKEEEQRTEGGWHTEISLAGIVWTPCHVCAQTGTRVELLDYICSYQYMYPYTMMC